MKHSSISFYAIFFFSLGFRGFSFSTPFLGADEALLVSEGAFSGSKGLAEGAMGLNPL